MTKYAKIPVPTITQIAEKEFSVKFCSDKPNDVMEQPTTTNSLPINKAASLTRPHTPIRCECRLIKK